ncbi:MAG: (Fe-S)-binding protein [Deltaproteobacteria bacterium]|jgi:Fe-S oxidoreductase/nitrate reductase gamma subunit|nr:(Fe-S)-binding protein [Deltaproteobacteria bacterium]
MGPIAMAVCMLLAFGLFAWSAFRRWQLLKVGAPEDRFDETGRRIRNTFSIALFQGKMPKYPVMGPVHIAIFWGFLVLLLNTVVLWGRGFDETFDLWILGDNWLGHAYRFVKDIMTVVVLVAALLALINRVLIRPERLTRSFEATLILMIIVVMMVGDLLYWGWQLTTDGVTGFEAHEPFASLVAGALAGVDGGTVATLGTVGFWVHSLLVLTFLNLLPYGKHFHVITAIPNVFFSSLEPRGRLPRDENIEKVLAEEDDDDDEEPVFGVAEIQHFTWKDLLDMYSCTECGRCTDNCPAAKTGKPLKPKQLLTGLRDHLYERSAELTSGKPESKPLVPDVVGADVVWSCTTCRACEEECPVMNTYVDKMVRLRRDLVEGRGEPPAELATALRGMETNSNPWNISPMDRDGWSEGLDVTPFDPDECEYLLYVGCMASFDDRAKKITRALVKLLGEAGVSYGYLGSDEPCCGETARRAGSESNFRMMADMNVEVFEELGVKKIITACPHCFNTLTNEYPVFGGKYEVVHHSQLLAELVSAGKLKPSEKIDQRVVYHDGCYLGRYNDVYSPPRRVLDAIPGLRLAEVPTSKQRGLCCGAGGARFFMEEEGERVNNRRIGELLAADPQSVATACPYCMTMLSDGLKDRDLFDAKGQLDVAELLAISCGLEERKLLRE